MGGGGPSEAVKGKRGGLQEHEAGSEMHGIAMHNGGGGLRDSSIASSAMDDPESRAIVRGAMFGGAGSAAARKFLGSAEADGSGSGWHHAAAPFGSAAA